MKRRRRGLLCAFPLLLGSLQCVEPLEAPSAYAEQRYLCTEEYAGERAALIERCREAFLRDRSCAGVVSFRGNLQSVPVVVESLAETGAFAHLDSGVPGFRIFVTGRSPYFVYEVKVSDLLDGPGIRRKDMGSDLRLNSRQATYRGMMTTFISQVELDTPDEVKFTLSSRLSTNDTFEGCFHLFPTHRVFD
jgi:hypothetical protein